MIEATHFADGETGRERAGRVQAGDARVGDLAQPNVIASLRQRTLSCQGPTQIMWWGVVSHQKKKHYQ